MYYLLKPYILKYPKIAIIIGCVLLIYYIFSKIGHYKLFKKTDEKPYLSLFPFISKYRMFKLAGQGIISYIIYYICIIILFFYLGSLCILPVILIVLIRSDTYYSIALSFKYKYPYIASLFGNMCLAIIGFNKKYKFIGTLKLANLNYNPQDTINDVLGVKKSNTNNKKLNKKKTKTCSKCGFKTDTNISICPHCHNKL